MSTTAEKVPGARWDLTPFFPTFQGPEYRQFLAECKSEAEALQHEAGKLKTLDDGNAASWAPLFQRTEELGSRLSHAHAYLDCLQAEDTTVEAVRQEVSSLSLLSSELEKIHVLLQAALKTCSDSAFESLVGHEALKTARFALERMRRQARYTMDAELETLAAELGVDGFHAWGRLYTQIAGGLEFELPGRGLVPMALKNSLLEDPDPEVRRATLVNSNAAWQRMETVAVACLNAISGTRLLLYKRRGIEHFLDVALEDACCSRKTLDTLMSVLRERRDLGQRYLKLKARLLGKERLGVQDLYAPLPVQQEQTIPWPQAKEQVLQSFGAFYPGMAEYARHAFEHSWLDTEARPGRSPGGFCTGSAVINQTRIFMTYNQAAGDVRTLAHELGHGFHEWVMRDLRPWQRGYPMTLAETASTFAEAVYGESMLEQASREEQAYLLDKRLSDTCAYLLNIPLRFDFEKRFYEERAEGELTASRFKELVLEAERAWYGEAIDPNELDAYFWASKLHFYITELSFYNFPYSFGALFSAAVFEKARAEGPSFLPRYEELLRLTGSDTCEGVARRSLGVDIEAPEFWHTALRPTERELDRFESLVQDKRAGQRN